MSSFRAVDAHSDPSALVDYLDRAAVSLGPMKQRQLELLDPQPGDLILDVGCGAGHDLRLLQERGAVAIGVDASAVMLATTSTRAHRPLVARAVGAALPFANGSFDGCRVERVLMHVEDARGVIAEMRRVLRPRGVLVGFEPDWASIVFDSDLERVSDAVSAGIAAHARHPRIGRQLARFLLDAGFIEVEASVEPGRFADLAHVNTIESSIGRAITTGSITRADADDWLAEQRALSATGRFLATFNRTLFRAVAPLPSAP